MTRIMKLWRMCLLVRYWRNEEIEVMLKAGECYKIIYGLREKDIEEMADEYHEKDLPNGESLRAGFVDGVKHLRDKVINQYDKKLEVS